MRSTQHPEKSWISVPVAGWLLSAVTFVAGTVLAPLYERLTFDGISIAQPFDARGFQHNDEFGTVSYTTVVKVANGAKTSIVIDSIQSPDFQSGANVFRFLGARASSVHDNTLKFPIDPSYSDTDSHLPILVKAEAAAILQIELAYRHDYKSGKAAQADLKAIVEADGVPATLRVNGKLRTYTLRTAPFPLFTSASALPPQPSSDPSVTGIPPSAAFTPRNQATMP